MPAIIAAVSTPSIAEELDIKPGDILLSINGHPINDILDYQFHSQDDYIVMEIEKANHEVWSLEIEKDYDENLGLAFTEIIFDRMHYCQNDCIFCFVNQLPPGLRSSLYIKDDDYRHSFINGNFITLTNLTESDWEKITSMHLSPLYVSVHSMQGDLRAEMLDNPRAYSIGEDLRRLKQAGIEVHTQIVLCPGWNDGVKLIKTLDELAQLIPSVASVGIVPVGLTGYRQGLPELRPVNAQEAKAIIEMVDNYQILMRAKTGHGFVYMADEFYLRAAIPLPPAQYYDDYCQIENGIGLGRMLLDEFSHLEASLPASVADKEVYLLTSKSGEIILQDIIERLNRVDGLRVKAIMVANSFFAGEVTVTGLLTGKDIITALGSNYCSKMVIIPNIVFKAGQNILLDGTTLDDIQAASRAKLIVSGSTAADLVAAILGNE